MPLNNIGDFLAGVFSPLALLWLVLGFFQQGHELRQSSEALRLQAKELQHSVEQQRLMVEVAKEDLAASKQAIEFQQAQVAAEREAEKEAARPRIQASRGGGSSSGSRFSWDVIFTNSGQECTNLSVSLTTVSNLRISGPSQKAHFPRGSTFSVSLMMEPLADTGGQLFVEYVDVLGKSDNKLFQVIIQGRQLTVHPL